MATVDHKFVTYASPAALLRRKVARVERVLERIYGAPKVARDRSVLDALIGTILSQNTNDLNSGRAWRNLKRLFPTWPKAAAAPAGKIEEAIRVGGLWVVKSKRIKAILGTLKETRGNYSLEFLRKMPPGEAFDYLSSFPGVGAKTAAVVLLFALATDIFPVDTHIHRICQRLGFVREGTSRDGVFEAMRPLVPPGKALPLHLNMIQFGRQRCTKRSPRCPGCPLAWGCLYVRGLEKY